MTKISKLNSQTVSPGQKLMVKLKKALFSAFESPCPFWHNMASWAETSHSSPRSFLSIGNYMLTKKQDQSFC